eukprot:10714838-Alexandrium_andersonii.AAC.1
MPTPSSTSRALTGMPRRSSSPGGSRGMARPTRSTPSEACASSGMPTRARPRPRYTGCAGIPGRDGPGGR